MLLASTQLRNESVSIQICFSRFETAILAYNALSALARASGTPTSTPEEYSFKRRSSSHAVARIRSGIPRILQLMLSNWICICFNRRTRSLQKLDLFRSPTSGQCIVFGMSLLHFTEYDWYASLFTETGYALSNNSRLNSNLFPVTWTF